MAETRFAYRGPAQTQRQSEAVKKTEAGFKVVDHNRRVLFKNKLPVHEQESAEDFVKNFNFIKTGYMNWKGEDLPYIYDVFNIRAGTANNEIHVEYKIPAWMAELLKDGKGGWELGVEDEKGNVHLLDKNLRQLRGLGGYTLVLYYSQATADHGDPETAERAHEGVVQLGKAVLDTIVFKLERELDVNNRVNAIEYRSPQIPMSFQAWHFDGLSPRILGLYHAIAAGRPKPAPRPPRTLQDSYVWSAEHPMAQEGKENSNVRTNERAFALFMLGKNIERDFEDEIRGERSLGIAGRNLEKTNQTARESSAGGSWNGPRSEMEKTSQTEDCSPEPDHGMGHRSGQTPQSKMSEIRADALPFQPVHAAGIAMVLENPHQLALRALNSSPQWVGNIAEVNQHLKTPVGARQKVQMQPITAAHLSWTTLNARETNHLSIAAMSHLAYGASRAEMTVAHALDVQAHMPEAALLGAMKASISAQNQGVAMQPALTIAGQTPILLPAGALGVPMARLVENKRIRIKRRQKKANKKFASSKSRPRPARQRKKMRASKKIRKTKRAKKKKAPKTKTVARARHRRPMRIRKSNRAKKPADKKRLNRPRAVRRKAKLRKRPKGRARVR